MGLFRRLFGAAEEGRDEEVILAVQAAQIALRTAGQKQHRVTRELMRVLEHPQLDPESRAQAESAARRLATAMSLADQAAPQLGRRLRGSEGSKVVAIVTAAAEELAAAADAAVTVVNGIVEASAELQFQRALEFGRGSNPNDIEAVRWCRLAALKNHAKAQNFLGGMYYAGRGVPQDYDAAIEWLRKSAEQGCPDGLRNLGTMYADGLGVEADKVTAYMWLTLAVAAKADYATEYLGKVAETMTEAQISQAKERARQWKPAPV